MKFPTTYTIASTSGNGLASSPNFTIYLSNFPTTHSHFHCRVKSFCINYGSIDETARTETNLLLVSNKFVDMGGGITGNQSFNVLAVADLTTGLNNNVGTCFIIGNMNSKTIDFRLLDGEFTSAESICSASTNWILTLELTGLDNFNLELY